MTRLLPLLALLLVGCGTSSSPTASPINSASPPPKPGPEPVTNPPVVPPVKKTPAYSVTAQDLLAEVKKDGKAAAEKYDGKYIQVEGVVTSTSRGDSGGGSIMMRPGGIAASEYVRFETADRSPWTAVHPGQSAKIQGQVVSTTDAQLELKEAVIASVGPALPALTAEALASEYAEKGERETNQKYHEKGLVVAGVVESNTASDTGAAEIRLKGKGAVGVVFRVSYSEKDDSASVKPGQMVRLVGTYTVLGDEKGPVFYPSHLLKNK